MTYPFLPGWYPVLRLSRLRRRPQSLALAGKALTTWRAPNGAPCLAAAVTGKVWPCSTADGYLYAPLGEDAGPFAPPAPAFAGPHTTAVVDGEVRARLADIAENILDTTHTSVVHQGYLRSASDRRAVDAYTTSGPGWIAATYPPGAAPGAGVPA